MGGNRKAFMTKTLSEEIMERTKLSSRFLKNPKIIRRNLITSKKVYVTILRKKRAYFMNLNENRNIDSKIFLQTVSGRIKIIEKKELVHSRKKLQIQIKSKTLRYLNFALINTLYQKLKNNPTLKAILGITLVLLLSNMIYPIGC